MGKLLVMRLIWNAGAAFAVTGLLTTLACFASAPSQPVRAAAPPSLTAQSSTVEQVADMPHRHYSGLQEHFEAANTSHDGKLTPAQAKEAGWSRVARHFDEIDTGHLGFVTEAQIHAYHLAHRHGRKQSGDKPSGADA